jgi:hypothetical protein
MSGPAQRPLPMETFEHEHVCLGHRPPKVWVCSCMICRPPAGGAASPKLCGGCVARA